MQITGKKGRLRRRMPVILGILLLVFTFNLMVPAAALAASDSLEITGKGVTQPLKLTRAELEKMDQHQEVYSCINTWPTKKWYVGKGVKLWDLLLMAGIKPEATMIRFTSTDSYTVLLTVKELFEDKRYRFPHFKTGEDGDGHLPGDPSGAVPVEPLIGLISVEGSDNPQYMNDMNTLLLMLGQRTVTEQTGNLFVKYLNKIEVFIDEPERWDEPQANPAGGTVPAGTMVTLSNLHNDDDKVYYTTDGSTPTMNSPMYNWIASRWWSSRADVLGIINHPIGPINEDTTIKAITIGPGKRDSGVVTFHYQVAGTELGNGTAIPGDEQEPEKDLKVIKLTIGRQAASVNGKPYTLDAAPYISFEAGTGRTLVPLRFISENVGADIDWDSQIKQVTITDEGKEIILTIDSRDVLVDGKKQTIDCAATIQPPNRTFVPLRFVIEALGAQVDYKTETKEITITR